MSVIERIFLAYQSGELSVKPDIDEDSNTKRLIAMEKLFGLSGEECAWLEDFLFERFNEYQQSGFYAGFKLAFSMISEVNRGSV